MKLSFNKIQHTIYSMLRTDHRVRLKVSGLSMIPFILNGDVIEIERVKSVRICDIVLAKPNNEKHVIHRVIFKRKGCYWIKGDFCLFVDKDIKEEDIIGKVVMISRNNKNFLTSSFIWKTTSIIWIAIGPIICILTDFFRILRRYFAKILLVLHGFKSVRLFLKKVKPKYRIVEKYINESVAISDIDSIPIKNNLKHIWVFSAKRKNLVIGSVTLICHPETDYPFVGFWLYALEVSKLYRGRGLGEALTQRVILQTRKEMAPELNLLVFEDNKPAIKLYHKLGFLIVKNSSIESFLADDVKCYGRKRLILAKKLKTD